VAKVVLALFLIMEKLGFTSDGKNCLFRLKSSVKSRFSKPQSEVNNYFNTKHKEFNHKQSTLRIIKLNLSKIALAI
jgi:adenylate cyclase class IV